MGGPPGLSCFNVISSCIVVWRCLVISPNSLIMTHDWPESNWESFSQRQHSSPRLDVKVSGFLVLLLRVTFTVAITLDDSTVDWRQKQNFVCAAMDCCHILV